MSYEGIVQQVFTNVSAFWMKAANRMTVARTALQSPPPNNYTADKFTADIVGFWFDTVDAWSNVPPIFGSPLLPTIFIASPATFGNPVLGSAFVAATVADGPVSVTDLTGTPGTIPAAPNTLTAVVMNGQLNATLKLPAPAAALKGSYQSLAFRASNPIGMIFVVLT